MAFSQGVLNKQYVSAIPFLDQREINPNLIDVARDKDFTDIMKLIGRYKPTKVPIYASYINQNIFATATVGSVTSGTGTAKMVIVLTAGTSGYARAGDLIRSSNANMVGQVAYVQSVTLGASGTGDTLTVWSVNNSPLYASTNDTINFFSNAFGEGSGAPASRKYGVTRMINQTQLFKEDDQITDIQKVSRVETVIKGQPYYFVYEHINKLNAMNGFISASMIAGQQSSTLYSDTNPYLTDSSSNPVQTTMGLDQYTTTYGVTATAASIGTLALTDIASAIDALLAVKAPLNQVGFIGSKARRPWDNLFKNLGSSGVTSVRLVIDGRTTDLEVDKVEYADAVFELAKLSILNHPQLFPYSIMPDVVGSIYFQPKDKVQVVGGGLETRLQIRYLNKPHLGGNSYSNGIITETVTGQLAPIPTNQTSILETAWYTNQGLEALGVQHFLKFRVA